LAWRTASDEVYFALLLINSAKNLCTAKPADVAAEDSDLGMIDSIGRRRKRADFHGSYNPETGIPETKSQAAATRKQINGCSVL
jgi:hypothetical protein